MQLPSTSSLREIARTHLQEPGIQKEKIKEQSILYDKMLNEKVQKGETPLPVKEGIIVFDEVKVSGKIAWNTASGKIVGVGLPETALSSLFDLFGKPEESPKPAEYVLQFLYRDMSSSFDFIGPYFTKAAAFTSDDIYEYFLQVLRCFEASGFNVRGVICDGASSNLSLIRKITEQEGDIPISEEARFGTPYIPRILHPYRRGMYIYWIICPSHQVEETLIRY